MSKIMPIDSKRKAPEKPRGWIPRRNADRFGEMEDLKIPRRLIEFCTAASMCEGIGVEDWIYQTLGDNCRAALEKTTQEAEKYHRELVDDYESNR